jgi:hypothetical protein
MTVKININEDYQTNFDVALQFTGEMNTYMRYIFKDKTDIDYQEIPEKPDSG